MLDLNSIDLSSICEALEDHSYDHHWSLDPSTGDVQVWSDLEDTDEEDSDESLIRITPISSRESYRDLAEFTSSVSDPRARDLFERAIAGRGAFRRFKDTLFDFPELRQTWFQFHDARMRRRALRWLGDQGVINHRLAEEKIQAHPDPPLPHANGPFDYKRIAREVEQALRDLYGNRLRQVIVFGSWARGDAHRESDVDLLIVLDRVESPWAELRTMEDVLWRQSIDNDTVVTGLPVGEADFENERTAMLHRARVEGWVVA